MHIDRRSFSIALAAALAGSGARAQAGLPRILVGFPAGGSADATARRMAEAWRGRLAEQVLVDNKVGAGGRIAVAALKDAAPDGQTLLLSPASMLTIYVHAFRKLQYNPATDVIPVSPVCQYAFAFGVGPKVPDTVKTVAQFLDWAKANPREAAFASPAAGAAPHFLGDMLSRASGVALQHVPYRGAAPGLQDLMGGQIASAMQTIGDFLPHLASGRVRVLATTDTGRSKFLPEVPTFTEQGLKPLVATETYGLFLPARTPAATVEKLADLVRVALREKAVVEGLAKLGFEPQAKSPDAYARQLAAEREQWGPIVKASGFSSDD
jgi:tripartite-type tricarboxylate transporter receptor subunit TctC